MYNILVVDDDSINRKLLTFMLNKHLGLVSKIYEAKDGQEALKSLQTHKDINLILLDIVMPVLDGVEFLKIYNDKGKNPQAQIIVLSTDDSQKTKVLSLGADDFMQKPIKEDLLIEKLGKLH